MKARIPGSFRARDVGQFSNTPVRGYVPVRHLECVELELGARHTLVANERPVMVDVLPPAPVRAPLQQAERLVA